MLTKMYKFTVGTILNKPVGAGLPITLNRTNKFNKPVPTPETILY